MSLEKTKIRRAIKKLARYYQNIGLDPRNFPGFAKQLRSPVSEAFLHEGTTYPVASSLLNLTDEEIAGSFDDNQGNPYIGTPDGTGPVQIDPNWRDNVARIVYTPFDTKSENIPEDEKQLDAVFAFLNSSSNFEIMGQGWRQPEAKVGASYPYSVLENCLPEKLKETIQKQTQESEGTNETPTKKITPVHVIQSFDPTESLQATDGDITTMLLGGIPGVEWSRSVPFFEILMLDPAFSKNFSTDAMSLYLGSEDAISKAKFDLEDRENLDPNLSVAGAMELFTMPQTLTAGKPLYSAMQGENPFAPLMTVESFSLSVSDPIPSKRNVSTGMAAKKEVAKLKIKIHDRTRMNLVLPFFRPGGTGRGYTQLVITYGWSHPDGNRIARHGSEEYEPLLGEVLNAARTTQVFSTQDMNYAFTDNGEVDLDLTLVSGPSNILLNEASMISGESVSSVEVSQILDSTIDVIEMMNAAGGSATRLNVGNSYIAALKEELKFDKDIELKLEALKEKIKAKGLKRTTRQVVRHFYPPDDIEYGVGGTILMGRAGAVEWTPSFETRVVTPGIDFSEYSELGALFAEVFKENTASVSRSAAARANSSKIARKLIEDLCKGPDPFLRPKPKNFPNAVQSCYTFSQFKSESGKKGPKKKNKYVSFGKALIYFAAPSLMKQLDVAEVQFIFHVFNIDAAGVFGHNIAQFPIPSDDLRKKIGDLVKEKGNITVGDFISFVLHNYLNDGTLKRTHAFGLKGVSASNHPKRLHKIYNDTITAEQIGLTTVVPKVLLKITQKPARKTLFESEVSENLKQPSVIRIEVYDENCTASPFHLAATEGNSGTILKKIRQEDRSDYVKAGKVQDRGWARHNHYYLQEAKFFADNGFLFDIGAKFDNLEELVASVMDFVENINSRSTKKIKAEDFANFLKSYLFLNEKFYLDMYPRDEAEAVYLQAQRELDSKRSRFRYTLLEKATANLIYGSATSSVTKLTLGTTQDAKVRNLAILNAQEQTQIASDDSEDIGRIPLKIVPGVLEMECMGNPFLKIGQEVFVDMGTNTGLDGIYRVYQVSHEIRPGEYLTKASLSPSMDAPKFVDAKRSLFDFIATTLGASYAGQHN